MTRADLASLLRKAQMDNINAHLTGLLLQVHDKYLQYIEGPQAAVQALLERVAADPRHEGLVKLAEGPAERRLFPHWSMAFQEVNGPTTRLGALNGLLDRALNDDPSQLSGPSLLRFWAECANALPR